VNPGNIFRFCRTYFLKHGKILPYLKDIDGLLYSDVTDLNSQGIEEELKEKAEGKYDLTPLNIEKEMESAFALERLQGLYVKLWLCLRASARVAYEKYTDVLEAGTFIQNTMDTIMKGKSSRESEQNDSLKILDLGLGGSDQLLLSGFILKQNERLQVRKHC
jgi:hypothetical protein